ncbi:MAG: PPOX class F420-dependent oxidoreductase [Pseudolysinimonas sp.]
MADRLLALADRRFVLLSTFRKTGVAVATPVWVVRDGDALLVSTPRDSGKLKRLRNDPRVQLVPCGRFGRVKRNQQPVDGIAEILDDAAAVLRVTELLRAKMPIEYPLILRVEGSRGIEVEKRVALRITAPPS